MIAKLPGLAVSGRLFLAVRFKAALLLRPRLATPLPLELRLSTPSAVCRAPLDITALLLRSDVKAPCHGPLLRAASSATAALPLRPLAIHSARDPPLMAPPIR